MQGTSIAGTVILYFQSSTGVFSGVESLYSVLCKKYTFGLNILSSPLVRINIYNLKYYWYYPIWYIHVIYICMYLCNVLQCTPRT